jgi:hypothetical protein
VRCFCRLWDRPFGTYLKFDDLKNSKFGEFSIFEKFGILKIFKFDHFKFYFFQKLENTIKTRVNFKPLGDKISQKFDPLHIYNLNLLKYAFFYF